MRLMQLMVVAMVAVLVQPAFAQHESKCQVDELMDELMSKKEGSGDLLNTYMMKASLDYRNYCVVGASKSIDMSYYMVMNVKIEKILRRHECSWEDIPKFRKMESLMDVCWTEGDIALVALVPKPQEDDLKLPDTVPIPPPEPKVVVKPPPDKKVEPIETVVRITPPLKKPDPTLLTITKPFPSAKSYWCTYAGASLAGAGLLSIGIGTYFGVAANNAVDNADSATDQPDVNRYNELALSEAKKANTMFVVAGAMLVAGAVMVILDFTVWGSPD